MSKSILDYIIDRKRLPSLPILLVIVVIIIGITIALCILLPIGMERRPKLVLFCTASFAIAMVIAIFTEAIFAIFRMKHIKKDHPSLWEITNNRNIPYTERRESLKSIKYLNDPILAKISKREHRFTIFPFVAWLILTIILIILSVFTDMI